MLTYVLLHVETSNSKELVAYQADQGLILAQRLAIRSEGLADVLVEHGE